MSVRIEYKPTELAYADFHPVDSECFPDEPLDEATFRSFSQADFWAAWDSDRLVGYCTVQRKPDLAWLRRIAVTRQFRRRGIGRQRMDLTIQHCIRIGLPDIILYVLDDNLPATRLYETFRFHKAELTYQYELPITSIDAFPPDPPAGPSVAAMPITEVSARDMPGFPRQWADIRNMHKPPEQYVLLFRNETGAVLGYCRLTPSFPGCFPFVIADPDCNLLKALQALKPYLLPDKRTLKLTFDNAELAHACHSRGYRLNYRLYKMIRSAAAGV